MRVQYTVGNEYESATLVTGKCLKNAALQNWENLKQIYQKKFTKMNLKRLTSTALETPNALRFTDFCVIL